MTTRGHRIALWLSSFVENPMTKLVKGLALFSIGVSEASRTFHEDLSHWRFRVGHGLVLIGFFGILEALPHLIDSLEAGLRYLELREQTARSGKDHDQ